MAIVEARRGNTENARHHRAQLQKLYDQTEKSTVENAYELATLRRWLGESYYQVGEYARAYDTFTRDDRSGLTKISDAILETTLFAYKPLLEPLVYAMAGTTSDGMKFVTELPTKVMLYRSAFKAGHIDVARQGYDTLLNEPQIPGLADLHFRLLHERALIALQDGDRNQARRYFGEAIVVLESQRSGLRKDDYKLGFVGNKIGVYGDMVALLVADGRLPEAFEYVERAKARALVDMLASHRDFGGTNGAAGTADLVRQLDSLERKSIQLASQTEKGAATRGVQIENIRQSLETASPELASLVTVGRENAADISSLLSPEEVLIEYFGHGDTLFAFVVTHKTVSATKLDGRHLADDVAALRSAI